MHLGTHCASILGPTWVQKGANLGSCWQLLLIFSGVHLEISPSAPYPIIYNTKWLSGHAKSGAKSIKNRSKRASKSIRTVIEKIVEMGIDFSTIFGSFWPPTWEPRSVLVPNLGGPGGPTNQPRGSNESGFWGQVGSRGPNGAQGPSKFDF